MNIDQLKAKRDSLTPHQLHVLRIIANSHKNSHNMHGNLWQAAGKYNQDYRQQAIQIMTGEAKPRPKAKCGISVYSEILENLTGIDFEEYEAMQTFFDLYLGKS